MVLAYGIVAIQLVVAEILCFLIVDMYIIENRTRGVSMKKNVFFLYESGIAERQGLNKVIIFLRQAKPA